MIRLLIDSHLIISSMTCDGHTVHDNNKMGLYADLARYYESTFIALETISSRVNYLIDYFDSVCKEDIGNSVDNVIDDIACV
jgi:hypothetical protein